MSCWPYVRALAHAGDTHRHAQAGRRTGLAMSSAFAPDGSLWMVGLNQRRQLFVQRSSDGAHWSAPRVIDTGHDTIAAEGELRPKLAFGPDRRVVISYTQPLSKPYTGEIRMLRSVDGGASFSLPFTVHRDRQLITHRFESIAFDSSGALHTLWIDKRDLEAARLKDDGGSYAGAAIYRNVSLDGGRTFGPDIKLADHSCECCRIALAPAAGGGLAAMWRHVFAGNVRDHAFCTIAAGGGSASEMRRASFDEWKIDACPHHGPGLASGTGGGYHAVWFGVRHDVPAIRYALLDEQGAPRGPVLELPDAGAEHADVGSVGTNVAIVWRSFDGACTRYSAWLSNDDGRTFAMRVLGSTEDESDNPFLVRRDRQLFAIWRTRQEVRVERMFG
ncbi:hypothetical protein ACG33_02150 [Steroidobacter denitrificans]|uniref:Glycosyl hydrolase n=1 Tax=Steroidobacter denitrificans TaxID=465721 RepID=A0A127F8G6_STEDE|nr:hypothetical protein ACG33_02150 [Steroidobacter denitrificans]